jgi:hypothetical protein
MDNNGASSSYADHAFTLMEAIPDFAGWLFLPFIMLATFAAIGLEKRFRK